MAATSMPAATLTALDVLRDGGNALDAAVAACAVLCVIEPQSTGIGGDCFCLYAPAGTGKVIALNGSGRAPAAATIDWYESAADQGDREHLGPCRHRARRGQRLGDAAEGAWPQGPATNCCSRRSATPRMAGRCIRRWPGTGSAWRRSCARTARTHRSCRAARRPNAGDIFRQPALAETLRAIARHGAKAFYEGPIAADIVATLRARGGLHTEEDFAAGLHNAEFVEPITLNWNGYDVYQCPPNGQGILVLMILGMLGGCRPPPTARSARCAITATSRRHDWPIATATRSSPIRRRPMCR